MALEARFPGKVVAIALDDSGDKAAHYHVDMRFPESGLARVDVDAANLEISGREPLTSPAWPIGMIHAVARITSAVEGPLLAAALDTANGAPAHYDVDVGLPDGWIARLKVDAASGQIGWRTPAVVSDRPPADRSGRQRGARVFAGFVAASPPVAAPRWLPFGACAILNVTTSPLAGNAASNANVAP